MTNQHRCCVDGCEGGRRSVNVPYCNRHDLQIKRHGRVTDDFQSLPGERWAKIEGKPGYEISDMGRLRSDRANCYVLLSNRQRTRAFCGRGNAISVHLEVAKAFVSNPFGDKRVIFLDGDWRNCRADNLQWLGAYNFDKAVRALQADQSSEAMDILAFMHGDQNALSLILTRQTDRLRRIVGCHWSYWRHCYGVKGDVDLDAVVQEALMKAIHAIKRGLFRFVYSLDGWFSKIAQNELKNAMRKAHHCGIADLGLRYQRMYA